MIIIFIEPSLHTLKVRGAFLLSNAFTEIMKLENVTTEVIEILKQPVINEYNGLTEQQVDLFIMAGSWIVLAMIG